MTDLESGPLPVVYYTITDWDQHYEVNTENRAWRPGQDFRQGPIGYLRIKARRDWNHRLILLYQLVGEEMWAAIGMFEKLAQVVACEPRPHREGGISDLDKNLSRSHDSTRFAFLSALKTLLRPSTRADIQTLVNCWDWLDGEIGQGRAPPERRQEVLGLAADCQRGDVPISVFLSRMREQYAYVPPTRRTMQLRGECDV